MRLCCEEISINAKHRGTLTNRVLFSQDNTPVYRSAVAMTVVLNLLIIRHVLQIWHQQTSIFPKPEEALARSTVYHQQCCYGCCRGIFNMQDKAFSLDMQDSLHQTCTTALHQPWE